MFRPRLESLDSRWLPSFTPAVNYGVGDSPQSVTTGHLNNDTHLDLVTANTADSTVSVRFGDGFGGFGNEHIFPTGANPVSVAVGDLDGDGDSDLATANRGGWDVSVLLGHGDGSFDSPQNTSLWSGEPTSLAVGDLDDDGRMDLVVGTNYYYAYGWYVYDYKYVEALMGYGAGGFESQSPTYIGVSWATGLEVSLAVGDLDGDGKLDDVAAVNSANNTASVLLENGEGYLYWSGDYAAGVYPQAVAITDMTGDGLVDVVTAGESVDVLPGLGGGTFGSPISNDSGGPWTTVTTADLNVDGKQDVVTANQGTGTASAFLGLGDGSLALTGDYPVGTSPDSVASGDFDGNGRPDAVIANVGSDNVSVLHNDGIWPSLNSRLSISDATVSEGHLGTAAAEFFVTLSTPSTEVVTVGYSTANGSATAGSDYQAAGGTVTFAPGETSQKVIVSVIGDRLAEANETYSVRLSEAVNAPITDGVGAGVILDDEPRMSINSRSQLEGKNGQSVMTFTVTLSATYDQLVTVNYSTRNGTATTGDRDYVAKSGTLSFAAGETTKPITVSIKGDKKLESDEYFYVDLSGASSNVLVNISRGVGTILNDD